MPLPLLIVVILVALATAGVLVVLGMVLWPRRRAMAGQRTNEMAGQTSEAARAADETASYRRRDFAMSDGGRIAARVFGDAAAETVIVLVHGIGVAGDRWIGAAGKLAGAAGARVVLIDLRGHGESSGRRYDLDRIGQYEDDLAEIVGALRDERPEARMVLAGHSMGGGIALRFALKRDRPPVDGYLLFAPVFGPGPTAPPRDAQEAGALRIDRARMTGLVLLNMAGIRAFNRLPVAFLDLPPDDPAYSFTAMASGLPLPPTTAVDALRAMEAPLLVLVGAEDTAVVPGGYAEVLTAAGTGQVEVVPALGHDSLLESAEVHARSARWLSALPVSP
ncbi:alpha/beta fold hydrolase [Psychromarinibacter sp. C21-152]|uniref:Alpha/beta fold hydrolase n=1 Tax=Psychromarinibacter sediminicola TaxID=3033385 RepID=A0AAE3T8K0_9RHOB|nr:alpha/beta fold hydrolase [Psychromarinibacter sediminicola]MDF0601505.1 alpha/beta fold hydrolase [Psychromarinibacter sediminicola]